VGSYFQALFQVELGGRGIADTQPMLSEPALEVLDRFSLSINSRYSSVTVRATYVVGQLSFAGGDI
jgi:hypothetical protein